MVPDRDHYVDAYGRLTTDMSKAAAQVAVKGCYLDDKVARRYGLTDELVSVDEPSAPRRMMAGSIPHRKTEPSESSVKIKKTDEESTTGPAAEKPEPDNPSSKSAAEPEKSKAPAKKAADQKGAPKKK